MSFKYSTPTTSSSAPCTTGRRENPEVWNARTTSSNDAVTSIETTSERGVMAARTRRSVNANTLRMSAASVSSTDPIRCPSRARSRMSAGVTREAGPPRGAITRITRRTEPISAAPMGRETTARSHITGALIRAIRSAFCSAMRLGTSSPTTRLSQVIDATMIANAIPSACRPTHAIPRSAPASSPDNRAPPNAAASVDTSVMPICTVVRKRSGSRASSRARAAARLPCAACCSSRPCRTDSSAISEAAKNPFASVSRTMKPISYPVPTLNR